MSLNYEYLFSQIDKAKKKQKKGYIPWNSPESKKLQEAHAKKEQAKPKTGRERGYGHVSEATNRRSRADIKAEKEAKEKKIQDEKDRQEKNTYTGVKGDFPPASHQTSSSNPSGRVVDMKIPKHIKGFGGKKQHHKEQVGPKVVTNLKPKDTKWTKPTDKPKPTNRRNQLRREIQDQKRADIIYEKERDTANSITSLTEFRRDRKKNPPASGGFVSAEESDEESYHSDYKKWWKARQAARAKREADKKERESIDPKTKLPKGPKVKPKPKKVEAPKEKPKTEGDPNPEVEGGIDGDDEYSAQDDHLEKSLWKSWYKKKVSMRRMKRPTGTKQDRKRGEEQVQMEKERQLVGTLKKPINWNAESPRTEESWEHFKERQDESDKRKLELTPRPKLTPKPTAKPKPKGPSGGFIQDLDDPEDIANKSLWKSWLKEKAEDIEKFIMDYRLINALAAHRKELKEEEEKKKRKVEGKKVSDEVVEANTSDSNKAEEGIGGMNMGSQRGLGHEAGYKQGSGQSAQITEVVEEEIGNESKKKSDDATEWHKKSPDKCVDCGTKGKKGNTVEPTYIGDDIYYDGRETGPGSAKDLVPLCQNCSLRRSHPEMFHDQGEYSKETKEENKSAYENHEQDEGPEVKSNKNQIPASKPGMDVIRSMYKKALITKYNNIYKPANI